MSFAARTGHSRPFWLAGFALLALYGCASSDVGSGGIDGGQTDASAGSGGSSSAGSGGYGYPGSGGALGSGGSTGSGGASSGTGSGGRSGSGGSSAGSGGLNGTGGSSGGNGGSGTGTPHCLTSIEIVSPTGSIEAGADATVRVQAFANEFPAMKLVWTWEISDYQGKALTPTNPDGNQAIAQFPVTMRGSYQVKATPSGDPLCLFANRTVDVVDPPGPAFNFRVSGSGYPTQDRTVKLSDGSSRSVPLEPGQPVTVKPIDPLNGALLDSFVRISTPNQSFAFEGTTTIRPVMTSLLATQNYSLLIAPTESATGSGGAGGTASGGVFAPYVQLSMPSSWSPQGFPIDQGTLVAGRTLTAGGAPIQNARMQLRSATGTPSTIGYSDAGGALTMWARDGSMSAMVIPPDGSGLPVATAGGALTLGNGASPSLTMQWAAMAQSTLTIQVQGSDGKSPVENAKVRLASAGMPYSAGTLTVQSPGSDDVTLPTTASVTASVQTAGDGHVTFPPFPPGLYTLTIIPPAAAAPAAVTTVPVTLTAGTVTQTIALARKVPLTGTLTAKMVPTSGQVTAIDIGNACTAGMGCPVSTTASSTSAATGSVFTGQADSNGVFSLAVDPDRTYELVIQPSGGSGSTPGRAVVPSFHLCSTATAPCTAVNPTGSVGTIALPGGLQYHGLLTDIGSGATVGGASIQVFCSLASSTCDPGVSLAEATSSGDGTFSVILPVVAQTAATLSK